MRRTRLPPGIALALFIVLRPAAIRAQPGADDTDPDVTGEDAATIERGIDDDVNVDHAFWMPTAIGQRGGTWKASATELVLYGLSYAVTDRLGVTIGTAPPIDEEVVGWLTIKWQIVRGEQFHVAIHSSALVGRDGDHRESMDAPPAPRSYVMPTLGAVATLCVDRSCRSLLNAYAYGQIELDETGQRWLGLAGSAMFHLGGGGDRVAFKAMLEFHHGRARERDWQEDEQFGWGGLRVSWRSFGFDAGLFRTFGVDGGETSELIPVLPWLKLAYRW